MNIIDIMGIIPGLPDEVTIEHVLTKLPWRTLSVLLSLSRAWQHAITSRQVYNARVRTSSTQTLVAMTHLETSPVPGKWTNLMSVYDTSTLKWHYLPHIPGSSRGLPYSCCCVSSQGKLYVLGGADACPPYSTSEVHVFDLISRGRWEKCANMTSPRQDFTSGVIDNKIYVFGGVGAERLSEVYDPARDSWYPIAPMLSSRSESKVISVQNEFFVHSGISGKEDNAVECNEPTYAEVYNTCSDEWRRIENFVSHGQREILVDIEGKLHKMHDGKLDVYNSSSMSWEASQRISWTALNRKGASNVHALPAAAVALDGELLALVYRYAAGRGVRLFPLKSKGLGLKNMELAWTKIPCSVRLQRDCLCSLQL